jgi:hypothetical protein
MLKRAVNIHLLPMTSAPGRTDKSLNLAPPQQFDTRKLERTVVHEAEQQRVWIFHRTRMLVGADLRIYFEQLNETAPEIFIYTKQIATMLIAAVGTGKVPDPVMPALSLCLV